MPAFAEDPELFAEMVEALRINAPILLKKIRDAIQAADSERLRVAAHTVKGSLSNFCRNRATRTALELEQMGLDQDMTRVAGFFEDLTRDVDHLIQYLTGALNKG